MNPKESTGRKNPLRRKNFLSRLIQLEEKLMSENYDFSVIEELVITYTVRRLISNWSSSTTSSRTPSRTISQRRSRSCSAP